MGSPGDLKRFNDTICELEGIKIQCQKCGSALVKVHIDAEGLPNMRATIPFMFCQTCDTYYIAWSEEDE